MSNADWLARDKAVLAGVLPRCSNIVAMRGLGSWIYDMEYNKYLDFASGIAVNSTGHCHPKVVEAISLQANTLIHTSVVTHNRLNIRLAEKLGELCPFFVEPQVFFCNSGAEAVDGAWKMARYITGCPDIVAFRGAFHGRTLAATSLTTTKDKYRKEYQPLMEGVHLAPYGQDSFVVSDLFNKIPNIGAILVEPILGEGGYVVPSKYWLESLENIAKRNNALLIFDEVQTGIGRTGYPFAAETFGVTPDVILFAKGIASGMPLGGIIADRRLMEQWPEGTHGSTFGGNPVSCVAALATLDVLEEEDCYRRVRKLGPVIVERLKAVLPDIPGYAVRGVGYMIGIEFPTEVHAKSVQNYCLNNNLIVLSCGTENNVIRLIPPLTVLDEEIEMALGVLERAINSVVYGITRGGFAPQI